MRYMGRMASVGGRVLRVELWQETAAEFEAVGALDFDAEEPLTIEWEERSKEEVLAGSSATLKVISPGDRTYEDLYSVEAGRVRMDVYRDGSLYWSGTIDTEFYEEPYESARGYTVTLMFSDMGVLGRLKFAGSGMMTLKELVDYAAAESGINHGGINETLISTGLANPSVANPSGTSATSPILLSKTGEELQVLSEQGSSSEAELQVLSEQGGSGGAMSLADIMVRADNFYDEEGEAETIENAVKGALQPLGLRMEQRGGVIWVYDLNGLYAGGERAEVNWNGSSQTLGTDRVYNNAVITWSPYAQSGNLAPEGAWRETIKTPARKWQLFGAPTVEGGAAYGSFHYGRSWQDWYDATDCGFTLWTSIIGDNAELDGVAKFFRIVPQYSGTESEGVAFYARYVTGGRFSALTGTLHAYYHPEGECDTQGYADLARPYNGAEEAMMKSARVNIPPVNDAGALLLRVKMDLLLDVRVNPFESATDSDIWVHTVSEKRATELMDLYGNYLYVPVSIKFKPDGGGDTVWVWTNKGVVSQDVGAPIKTLEGTKGTWVQTTEANADNFYGYLCWYDKGDRKDKCGVLGWKANRPAINPHKEDFISVLANCDDGQYIPYPDAGAGGELWIEVRKGWILSDRDVNLSSTEVTDPKELWKKVHWALVKLPEIEILNGTQFDQEISDEEIEYSAELNAAAKDPLEIETVCGTSAEGVPTARGAYFETATNRQITELTRAGRTTQAEELLIGTLYSQYAQRRVKLTGEADILPAGLRVYTEGNQPGKLFMAAGDVEDLRAETSDATFIELRPDEYDKIG